mmetsp:Transcript_16686/g.30217  ORF Transcript_16686/g.30217 Transcript_16686/m.30217 type:complete len:217 (+) Transcript_16686:1297-1947(+)
MHNAAKTMMGVYTFAKLSTSFSVSDRFDCASSTRRMSLDTAELLDVAVILTTSCVFPVLIVPPDTLIPGDLFTGRLSPVKLDSSMVDLPSVTIPSHGTLSPVRTETSVPTATALAGRTTMSFVAGFMTLACSGRRHAIADRALRAREVARVSSASLMANRKVTAADSVYSWSGRAPTAARSIMQLTSKRHRRSVRNALTTIGGKPNATDRRAIYLR